MGEGQVRNKRDTTNLHSIRLKRKENVMVCSSTGKYLDEAGA